MTVVARHFALMTEAGFENMTPSCITSFGIYTEILHTWETHPEWEEKTRELIALTEGRIAMGFVTHFPEQDPLFMSFFGK